MLLGDIMRKHECWTIAYRKRELDESGGIFNSRSAFTTIKNTWRYWCADPHLYESGGGVHISLLNFTTVYSDGV